MSGYELLNREVELKDKTPVSQAIEIIMILDGMWLTDFDGDMGHKAVLTRLFKAENVDAAALNEALINNIEQYDHKTRYLGFLLVISAYCVQAIGEYMDNNEVPTNLAWAYVVQAERQLSHLDSARTRIAIEKQIPALIQSEITERASKAGKAAHANTDKQKIKKEVEQQFNDSSYPFHKRGYTTKFVNEMCKKYPKIENIKTIQNWVAEMKKSKQL